MSVKYQILRDVPKELQEEFFTVSSQVLECLQAGPGLHIPYAIEKFEELSVELRGIAKKLREY